MSILHGTTGHVISTVRKIDSTSDHHILARRIDAAHIPLFDTTKFKIIRHVPIHVNILLKRSFLLNAINSFGNCFGMLLDFSHGIGAPLLTCIFRATRETSYYTIDHVQSQIIEANTLKINLHLTRPDIPPPPAQSLRSPPSIPNPPFGRGRGRGSSSSRAHRQYPSIASDRSSTVFRIAKNNPLPLQSQLILKYYVIVNGAGNEL